MNSGRGPAWVESLAGFQPSDALESGESPRPFLHPLRTRAGVKVTAARQPGHTWHAGLSVALADVSGHNFWGGPSYVHGSGYVPRSNHGRQDIRSLIWAGNEKRALATLHVDWTGADGKPLIAEARRIEFVRDFAGGWALVWHSTLSNVTAAPLVFNSPATKGRAGAGYGGITWRGPEALRGGRILTPDAQGASANGRVAPWLAYATPDDALSPVTLLFATPQPVEWFARVEPYALAGPALAGHCEKSLTPGTAMQLDLAIACIDGRPSVATLPEHACALRQLFGAAVQGLPPSA